MRVCVWLLAFTATTAILLGSETTNLVEILRRFQAELDAREGRTPLVVQPRTPVAPAQPEVGAPAPTAPVQPPVGPQRPHQPTGATTSVLPAEYRLQAGDRVRVEVVDEPGMSVEEGDVAEDGTIRLPIVGLVSVLGKTVEEATRGIREILERDYLVNPRVQVKRLGSSLWPEGPASIEVPSAAPPASVAPSIPSSHILITNQVAQPGKYRWSGEEMTLRRAIELAGGATARADLTRVRVSRLIGGERRELEVDLEAPEEARRGGSLLLKAGDEVEVPVKK